MIVHLTTDLMSGSFLSANAASANTPLKMAGSSAKVKKLVDENEVDLIVIDLQANGLDLPGLVDELRKLDDSRKPSPPIVAYAQHVYGELLQEAKDLKIETIMTRGEFSRKANEVVEKYCKK